MAIKKGSTKRRNSGQAKRKRSARLAAPKAGDELPLAPDDAKRDARPAHRPAPIARPGFAVVGIGASAGGLAALQAFFDAVPANSGVAFVVVTHQLPWRSRSAIDALENAAAPASNVIAAGTEKDSPRFAPVFATTDESAKWVRARPHVETARGLVPLVDGLRLALQRSESARVALADGHTSQIEGPCLVEFWSIPLEVGGWRIIREDPLDVPAARTAPVERAGTEGAAPSARKSEPGAREVGAAAALHEAVKSHGIDVAEPGTDLVSVRAWARAAVALREDDLDAADRAFDELGHALEPATRDAARLARAQLWISRGREAAVRPVLEQLAQSGATALIRQRATEFLYR